MAMRFRSHSNGADTCLVEVVDVEDEPAIRSGVRAKIADVCVSADLREDAGIRQCGEIRRHDRDGATEEAEGRCDHTLVFELDERCDSPAHRAGNGDDGRWPVHGRTPICVVLPTQLFSSRLTQRVPLRRRNGLCHSLADDTSGMEQRKRADTLGLSGGLRDLIGNSFSFRIRQRRHCPRTRGDPGTPAVACGIELR